MRYNYDFPYAFWFFLGKIASKPLFQNESQLEILSFVRVRNREFVGHANKHRDVSRDQTLNVVEVDLQKPQPNEPVQIFWKPARGIIIGKIKQCKFCISTPMDLDKLLSSKATGMQDPDPVL